MAKRICSAHVQSAPNQTRCVVCSTDNPYGVLITYLQLGGIRVDLCPDCASALYGQLARIVEET